MASLALIEKALKKSQDRYQMAMKRLGEMPTNLSSAAQEAQIAWSEVKKLELEYNNASVMREMTELYGA